MFEPEEIEEILTKIALQTLDNIDCSRFINKNREWFEEMIAEEVSR
jgi:hypothetical protein